MKKFFLFIVVFYISIISTLIAQGKDYELGSSSNKFTQQTGLYDLSDPETVNIKVSIWGFVRFPGRYIVPVYTTVTDLLSFAGGPTEDAHLDDLRIYRVNEDSSQSLIKINYNDIMYENNLEIEFKKTPSLEAGDILVAPGSPRLYTRDKIGLWVSVLSALISISILILTIVRK